MGKRPIQETKRVSDTIRREEAHVESEGDVDVQGTGGETASG
jgi:stress response protein YsnF